MARTFTATGYDVVPPGMYVVEFEQIKDKTTTFTEDDGTEKTREYMSWSLPIAEGPYKDRLLFANVSNSFGPKSKLRKWAEQMIGHEIEEGEYFDVDDLVGKRYQAMVENVRNGKETYANVVGLYAVRDTDGGLRKAQKVVSAAATPENYGYVVGEDEPDPKEL
jgi:hypothetical protein